MALGEIETTGDLRRTLEGRKELTHIHAAVIDNTGHYSLDKFLKGLECGIALTSNLASADTSDVIFLIDGLMGGDSSFSDALVHPVPETLREIPWESPRRNLQILMEYSGDAATFACPRSLYKKQLARAEQMGFRLNASFELEFRLFRESLTQAIEKGFRDLTSCPELKQYLGVQRYQCDNDYFNGLLDTMVDMRFDIETYHTELDAGLHEMVMRYQSGMRAADDCSYIRTFIKIFTQRYGRLASFMARPSDDEDGSGLHSHISLQKPDGGHIFYDENAPYHMSDVMRHFIGGLQRRLPELQLMLSPNVNSFRRFKPWLNAPVATSWGIDNRTVGLRVVGNDSPNSIRVENRLTGG
ncbi:MAG: glutamine synthetase [Candidatus Thiodiazotropha sp. (ex Ustalcina ferruginea)]|nr:glutamine synthetase [Candidatus Thiodiazotropha sp. (ex Ustalcina ferruginea)]